MIRLMLLLFIAPLLSAEEELFRLKIRASEIDPKVKSHPKIGFVLEDKNGKAQDYQNASVDLSAESKGRLVIWLMGHNQGLFDRVNSYGLHAIQVHYARQWFSKCCQQRPVSEHCRGNMRLEAATGEDHSDEAEIDPRDSIKGRAFAFVKHLSKTHPEGKWEQFLNGEKSDLDWEKIILAGSSHGSTTAARLSKHTKVARVVALCGPRDQHQTWQSLPSKTPANRIFGFSHVEDMGWKADHYCRSWELLGLHQFGAIVNVDQSKPPYQNTRRLVTNFDVKNDEKRAHSTVTPGKHSYKNKEGKFMHEPVWRYLFTHPVGKTGNPVPPDDSCDKEQKQSPQKK